MALNIETSSDKEKIHFKGVISVRCYTKWAPSLENQLKKKGAQNIHVSFDGACVVDSSSLYIIAHLIRTYDLQGKIVWDNSPQSKGIATFLQEKEVSLENRHTNRSWFLDIIDSLGEASMQVIQTGKDLLGFFGYILVKTYAIVQRHKRLPLVSLTHHLEQVGFKAIPIIALISFLIGMVLAYQGINQLSRFGAEIYTIDFLTIGIFREIGVLLTAIVVAGRSASSFTAHIGTMNLNEEIDAMRIMQLDPVLYLVLPRIAALLVALPLLVFLSDMAALLGGMMTTQLVIDLSPLQFLSYLKRSLTPTTFWVGMSKAPLFALLIGLVGCFRGMQVRKSSESVGRMTTASVVEAIFLVIVSNALMSLLFSYLKV